MTSMQMPEFSLERGHQPVLLRVLIVDDDEVDRLRLQKICSKAGLMTDFHEAANLQEMRRKLDVDSFDLVFLDHNLGMDTGLDALKILLAHEDQVQAIPIMLTSSTSYQLAVEAMRRGCADYIVKEELSVDSLIKSVAAAIERRALYGQLTSAKRAETELKQVFHRFMAGCGPELRVLLRRALASVRVIKSEAKSDGAFNPEALSDFSLLERSCKDLVVFMDDLETVIAEGWALSYSERPSSLQ
ncbi:response regulator [Leisingera sp. ANG-Vp]|uniref:response regulator n=1 Tax=Leisingera sp. ANG-Vp TaxID=1577896 RepID=UPI00057E1B10|nr:response regulator [Leisingera sp. ANG-Vp]KIC13691.1 response regulator receiver protein [Leisingera sp. ANG-Vp]